MEYSEPIVLMHYGSWIPTSDDAIYGVGGAQRKKEYLEGEGYIRGMTSHRKSDFLLVTRVFSACPVGL